jgi:hypothetical protein
MMFTRSTDCGNTWATPVKLNVSTERANQGAALAVDPHAATSISPGASSTSPGSNTGTDALVTVKHAGNKPAHLVCP